MLCLAPTNDESRARAGYISQVRGGLCTRQSAASHLRGLGKQERLQVALSSGQFFHHPQPSLSVNLELTNSRLLLSIQALLTMPKQSRQLFTDKLIFRPSISNPLQSLDSATPLGMFALPLLTWELGRTPPTRVAGRG